MYCKAGVACTNPEVYGDIKRGRRLAPSKGITCPRCQGKCCNEACLEKHKCKQRARPSTSVHGGIRGVGNQRNWHLDPTMAQYDAAALGITDPNMLAALSAAGLRGGQGGLFLQGSQQFGQPLMLGAGPGGSLMPIIQVPMLPMMLPGMQQGADGSDAAQLQAALAAMQQTSGGMVAGGASAPMLLAPMPGQEGGTPTAAQVANSQALQFAQLQGLGGTQLLQLTADGQLGSGQRLQLQLPAGLMQNMHMLPGGLQILSAEGLQLTTDANGNMQMMQVLPQDGSVPGADQAALDAAAAAQAGLPLIMGGNVIDPSALAAAMSAAAAAGEAGDQTNMMDHTVGADVAAAAAEAAAQQGMTADHAALQNALEAAAGTSLQMQAAAQESAAPAGLPTGVPAEVAAQVSQPEQQQGLADAAAVASAAAGGAVPASAELPLPVLPGNGATEGAGVSALPAIAPLTMSPAIAEALKAVASGRPPNYHNAEEDAAAAALMSLATDKKKKAEELMRQAEAAVAAAQNGIISHAAAEAAVQEAQRLKAEAEAEEAAAAAEAKLAQAQHEQQALQQLQEQQQLALQHLAQQQLAAQQAGMEQPQFTQEQLEQALQHQAALQQQAIEQQALQHHQAYEDQQKALLQQQVLEMQQQAMLQQQADIGAAQQQQPEGEVKDEEQKAQ